MTRKTERRKCPVNEMRGDRGTRAGFTQALLVLLVLWRGVRWGLVLRKMREREKVSMSYQLLIRSCFSELRYGFLPAAGTRA